MSATSFFIVGAGSVGSFLAVRLPNATLIAREKSAATFQNGLSVIGDPHGSTSQEIKRVSVRCKSWNQVQSFPENSVIFVTVKLFNLGEALSEIQKRLPQSATLILCQNGLGVLDEAKALLRSNHVRWGRMTCWFGVRLDRGTSQTLPVLNVFGVNGVETWLQDDPKTIEAAFHQARIPSLFFKNAEIVEWRKALINIATNGICALVDAPNGALAENEQLRSIAEKILSEAASVAKAEGVSLERADTERVFENNRVTARNFNSMIQDLRAGRATEMPWINAKVVEKARNYGISTPVNETIASLISYLEKNRPQ